MPEHQDALQLRAPATQTRCGEVRRTVEQYVRKVGGFAKPSRANKHTFAHAIDEVASAMRLFEAPVKTPPPRDREVEAERTRAANCFGAA